MVICRACVKSRSWLSNVRCMLSLLPQTNWSRSACSRNSPKSQVDTSPFSSSSNCDSVSSSRHLRLWKRNCSAITNFFGFRWFFNVSISSSNVLVDGRFGLTTLFTSLYVLPSTNVRNVATRFFSAVCRVSSLSAAPAGNAPIPFTTKYCSRLSMYSLRSLPSYWLLWPIAKTFCFACRQLL